MHNKTTSFDFCQANLKSAKITISLSLIILGIVTNFSVVAALLRKVASLNGFNLLVVHLAFADLMVFFTATPFLMLSTLNQKLAFHTVVCEGTAFLNRLTTVSSMLILTAMAGCRFYSVKKPLSYRVNVKSSRINRACGLLWIFSLALSVSPFLGWGKYEHIKGQCWCALDSAKYKLNYVTVLVLAFCLPTALSCYFLVGIIVATRKARKAVTQKFNQARGKDVQTNPGGHLEGVEVETNFDQGLNSFQKVVSNLDNAVIKFSTVLPGLQITTLQPLMTPSTTVFPVRMSFPPAEKQKQPKGDQESRKEVLQTHENVHEVENAHQKSHQQVKASKNDRKERHQNANKALYNLISLFLVYIICCGPTYVVWSWYAFSDSRKSKPPRALFAIFRAMAGAQSVANSIIYGIRHEDIRKEVFKLWTDIAKYAKSKILNALHNIMCKKRSRNDSSNSVKSVNKLN